MKIGIETIYDSYNFGCYLQAYAMQDYLKSRGHDVVIHNHSNLRERIKRRYFAKSICRSILKLRRFLHFSRAWRELPIEKFSTSNHKDLTIIGSDEIWNIENESFAHISQFYGINCNSERVVIYGPSLGFSSYESYLNHPEYIAAIQSNIDGYMVRDNFTGDFLKKIGVTDIYRICDPTFLLLDKWISLRKPCTVDSDYILYYSYHSNTPYRDYIMRFAREHKLKVVVGGFNYDWCDEQRIVDPFEFLDLVYNAKYIVTSTFHGSIFSTIFRKQFIVIHPNDKVVDLIHHYNINRETRDFTSYDDFCEQMRANIDYNPVFDIIREDRKFSMDRLNSFLHPVSSNIK